MRASLSLDRIFSHEIDLYFFDLFEGQLPVIKYDVASGPIGLLFRPVRAVCVRRVIPVVNGHLKRDPRASIRLAGSLVPVHAV